eukprot:m.28144 g.28144  ORF g.28144 m.28144 type:complete len:284 (+) comp9013_c0_seq1:264-1115(+)
MEQLEGGFQGVDSKQKLWALRCPPIIGTLCESLGPGEPIGELYIDANDEPTEIALKDSVVDKFYVDFDKLVCPKILKLESKPSKSRVVVFETPIKPQSDSTAQAVDDDDDDDESNVRLDVHGVVEKQFQCNFKRGKALEKYNKQGSMRKKGSRVSTQHTTITSGAGMSLRDTMRGLRREQAAARRRTTLDAMPVAEIRVRVFVVHDSPAAFARLHVCLPFYYVDSMTPQRMLLACFERADFWTMAQLSRELGISTQALRPTLEAVAELQFQGPHSRQWRKKRI